MTRTDIRKLNLSTDEADVLKELRKRKGKLITIQSLQDKLWIRTTVIRKVMKHLMKEGLAARAFVRSSDGYYAYRSTFDQKIENVQETLNQIKQMDT